MNKLPKKTRMKDLRKTATILCASNTTSYSHCNLAKKACLFNIKLDPCERYNLAETYVNYPKKKQLLHSHGFRILRSLKIRILNFSVFQTFWRRWNNTWRNTTKPLYLLEINHRILEQIRSIGITHGSILGILFKSLK